MTTITRRRNRTYQSRFTQATQALLNLIDEVADIEDQVDLPFNARAIFEEFGYTTDEYRAEAHRRGLPDSWFFRNNLWEMI